MKTAEEKRKYNMLLIFNAVIAAVAIFAVLQQTIFKSKIGYIDTNKVFNEYKGLLNAKNIFQKKVTLYQKRVDTLSAYVKVDILHIEKFKTDKVKAKQYEDSARLHKTQLMNYQRAMTNMLKEEETKLSQPEIEKFNRFLKKYGKDNNYDIIFIANNTGTIGYAKDAYDLTDDILKEINQQ